MKWKSSEIHAFFCFKVRYRADICIQLCVCQSICMSKNTLKDYNKNNFFETRERNGACVCMLQEEPVQILIQCGSKPNAIILGIACNHSIPFFMVVFGLFAWTCLRWIKTIEITGCPCGRIFFLKLCLPSLTTLYICLWKSINQFSV